MDIYVLSRCHKRQIDAGPTSRTRTWAENRGPPQPPGEAATAEWRGGSACSRLYPITSIHSRLPNYSAPGCGRPPHRVGRGTPSLHRGGIYHTFIVHCEYVINIQGGNMSGRPDFLDRIHCSKLSATKCVTTGCFLGTQVDEGNRSRFPLPSIYHR